MTKGTTQAAHSNHFNGLPSSSLNTTMHLSTTAPQGGSQPYEAMNSFNLSNMTTQRNEKALANRSRVEPSFIMSGETLLSSPEFDNKENRALNNILSTAESLGISKKRNYN